MRQEKGPESRQRSSYYVQIESAREKAATQETRTVRHAAQTNILQNTPSPRAEPCRQERPKESQNIPILLDKVRWALCSRASPPRDFDRL